MITAGQNLLHKKEKMHVSARTFAADLLHGTIQAPPGVNIPAVLLPVLEAMAQTDTWPPNFSDFLC